MDLENIAIAVEATQSCDGLEEVGARHQLGLPCPIDRSNNCSRRRDIISISNTGD